MPGDEALELVNEPVHTDCLFIHLLGSARVLFRIRRVLLGDLT